MNTTLTADLAQAHISELRRQACHNRFAGSARAARRARRAGQQASRRHRRFDHFLPVYPGLFHL
jgi:hypothetical protein